jgi:hypothetical protein
MKNSNLKILSVLFLVFFPIFLQSEEMPSRLSWNPSEKDSLQLDGIWDFYWKEWIEPGQAITAYKKRQSHVPGIWNGAVAGRGCLHLV